jgi:dTDP-4-amino-4,6-dideoxygalactose transaminase
MNWKIPLFKIYWDEDDLKSIAEVIRRGMYWSSGPEIKQLEEKIAQYLGTKYAVSFNSGTSALHAALLAYNIFEGEVIVPSFTFIATANAVALAGAKPVFAEIEDQTYGLDPEDVKEKITTKTRAIIPVHYGGSTCTEIQALQQIAEDHDLTLIEDAAESFGSKRKDKLAGTFGHSAMFSFCQNKIITAGEGGILVTNDYDVYQRLKLLCSHGRVEQREEYFSTTKELDYVQLGYNYRISTISAALALSQFQKIKTIIDMRRKKANYYKKQLSHLELLQLPKEDENHFHVYQLYTIRLDTHKNREEIKKRLTQSGIMTKIYFEPIHLKTYYQRKYGHKEGDLPKTESISKKVLTLPLYPTLSEREMDVIIHEIEKCCR